MKNTKAKLLSSITIMLVCFAMLLGSTYAWFTDQATTGVNKIHAGNLDLVVEHKNASVSGYETIEDKTNLFKDAGGTDMKWEPGAMSWETFKVSNAGSLAFKYVLQANITGFNTINVNGTDKSLKDVLKVKVLEGNEILPNPTREAVAAMDWSNTTDTLDSFVKGDGKLYPNGTENQKSSEEFQVIVYWMPTANDNDWNVNNGKVTSDRNPLFIDFGIKVLASQLEHESDSFDNTYDKNATYSESITTNVVDGQDTKFTSNVTPLNEVGATTTVVFPASVRELTENSTPELTVVASPTVTANNKFTLESGNGAVGAIDLTLTVGGQTVSNFNNNAGAPVEVTVTTYVAKGLTDPKLYYNGEEVTIDSYNSTTGELVFKTTHFSTYVLEAKNEAYIVESNTAYSGLQESINNVLSGQTVVLLKDVKLTNPTGENCIQIKETMTLDGNGNRIYCEDSTLPDNARLVNITGISNKDITIKNIIIESSNYGTWMRGLNLYQVDNINLNIVDSVIQIPHYYALNIATECTNTTISIDSTTIRGWSTIYNHSSGVNLTANNSTFDSVNPTSGGGDDNSFTNIVVAEYYNWDGSGDSTENNFVFNNCEFTADKLHPEADVNQVVFDIRSPFKNTLTVNNCLFSKLATPEYIKVCSDTEYEDNVEKRASMRDTNTLIIDGEPVDCLSLDYVDYYIDE